MNFSFAQISSLKKRTMSMTSTKTYLFCNHRETQKNTNKFKCKSKFFNWIWDFFRVCLKRRKYCFAINAKIWNWQQQDIDFCWNKTFDFKIGHIHRKRVIWLEWRLFNGGIGKQFFSFECVWIDGAKLINESIGNRSGEVGCWQCILLRHGDLYPCQ